MTEQHPVHAPPVEEIEQVLALHPIFGRFDPPSLRAVAARCGFATFPAGETIMRQGDRGTFACVILEGEVEVYYGSLVFQESHVKRSEPATEERIVADQMQGVAPDGKAPFPGDGFR